MPLPNWAKGLIAGLLNGGIGFMTAFLNEAKDVNYLADINDVTWAIMGAGAIIQVFIAWRLLFTKSPKDR